MFRHRLVRGNQLSEYFDFGDPCGNGQSGELRTARARNLLRAIEDAEDFILLEIRSWSGWAGESDVLVVEVKLDGVPTRNRIGILYRERIAIAIPVEVSFQIWLFALRKNFPRTLHQNLVSEIDPRSPCLYEAPWAEVALGWTPEKFLARIHWWFGAAARGDLHAESQALEPPFLPVKDEIVVPQSLLEGRIQSEILAEAVQRGEGVTVKTFPLPSDGVSIARKVGIPLMHVRVVQTTDQFHSIYDRVPRSVAALSRLLDPLGVDVKNLIKEIARLTWREVDSEDDFVVLVGIFPRKREQGKPPERADYFGFFVESNLSELALKLGVSAKHEKQYVPLLAVREVEEETWEKITIRPLNVVFDMTPETFARLSGIAQVSTERSVLIGAGALGSQILENCARMGWGSWTIVDSDHLLPHNLARHIGLWKDIGYNKSEVAIERLRAIYPTYAKPTSNHEVLDVVGPAKASYARLAAAAELVVDASASIRVSREAGRTAKSGRVVSTFLSPSGTDLVMIAEDVQRTNTVDALEAQYWRWVVTDPWGSDHCALIDAEVRYGGGCNDVSVVLPGTRIAIAGAIASQALMEHRFANDMYGHIWRLIPESMSIEHRSLDLWETRAEVRNQWRIVWDMGITKKLSKWRDASLPKETGGILVGYIDHTANTIYVVDAWAAPPDSEGHSTYFQRGIKGLADQLEEAFRRSSERVGYLGEWHSHPRFARIDPSPTDDIQLAEITRRRRPEGEPALMLIVGDGGMNWVVRD